MSPRYFSVEEANEVVDAVRPLMADLLERRARVVAERDKIANVLEQEHVDSGGAEASAMVKEFIAIEALIDRIRGHGCELKDINVGLLDFLAQRDGREVYLCWRYDEPRVSFYHELHTGFNGRQPI